MDGLHHLGILVVAHNPWLRHALTTTLHEFGASVGEASNGASALRKAFAEPPHLLIVGSDLPELSASELIDSLRSDPRTRSTAIVGVDGVANVDASLDLPCGALEALAVVVEALEARRHALAATPMRSVNASALGRAPLVDAGTARSTSRTRNAGRSGKWRLSSGIDTL